MAYECWSNELPGQCSRQIKQIIYEYMVRYYDRNRGYSFSAVVGDQLKGFLLAFQQSDSNINRNWLLSRLRDYPADVQQLAFEYERYYEYNGKKAKECHAGNGMMIGLFISAQKGCGEKLLSALYQKCTQMGIRHVYLWTDMSCNYNYYYHHDFEELSQFTTTDLFDGEILKTIIFRKCIT